MVTSNNLNGMAKADGWKKTIGYSRRKQRNTVDGKKAGSSLVSGRKECSLH